MHVQDADHISHISVCLGEKRKKKGYHFTFVDAFEG